MNNFSKALFSSLKLKELVAVADQRVDRLLLIVGDAGTGKTRLLADFARDLDKNIINANLFLSNRLLSVSPQHRSTEMMNLANELTNGQFGIVLLDNIELLFDVSLQINPLLLLTKLSRNKTVVATWSGSIESSKLVYGKPNHPEYRSYDSQHLLYLNMNEKSTSLTP